MLLGGLLLFLAPCRSLAADRARWRLRRQQRRGRQAKAAWTSRSADPDAADEDAGTFERPLCAYPPREGFAGHVQVYVSSANERYLNFDDDLSGAQTEVKCLGPVPAGCLPGPLPPGAKLDLNTTGELGSLVPSCDEVECPCAKRDSGLDFSYMSAMMQDVVPLCKERGQGAAGGDDPVFRALHSGLEEDGGPLRVLMVGLGGGALASYLLSACPEGSVHLESVEYDPRVIEVATKFFGFRMAHGRNEVEQNDGGEAVARRAAGPGKSSYDVVMVDCFEGQGDVPDSCKNDRFIQSVRGILRPQGRLIQQIWSPQYEKVIQRYQALFGADAVSGQDIDLGVNHLILATRKADGSGN